MERITIDVIRTRGTRSATVRVHVSAAPGRGGSAWRHCSIRLAPEMTLSPELAAHIAHSVELAVKNFVPQPWVEVELPLS